MALLEEINYSPGEDSMQEVFDKINIAIQNINSVLGGKNENDGIRKASSSDFDFEVFKTGGLNFKVIEIGGWNMQTTSSKPTFNGLAFSKIVSVSVWIRNDASSELIQLTDNNAGYYQVTNDVVSLERDFSGDFNSPSFSNSSINRGFITILYLK